MSFYIQGFELPEDEHAYSMAINGPTYHAALSDIEHLIKERRRIGSMEVQVLSYLVDEILDLVEDALTKGEL